MKKNVNVYLMIASILLLAADASNIGILLLTKVMAIALASIAVKGAVQ